MHCFTLRPAAGSCLGHAPAALKDNLPAPVPLHRLQQRVALPSLDSLLLCQPRACRAASICCHGLPPAAGGAPTPAQPESSQPASLGTQGDDFEPLTPEEDATVPGNYADAMNGNTRLGKAIRAACSELSHLNQMEQSNLQQAEALLKKLGLKSPLITQQLPPVPGSDDDEDDDGDAAAAE